MNCKICNKEYKLGSHLSQHISKIHKIDKKKYYDLYFKKDMEGICPICGNETQYSGNWQRGYIKYCSKKCKSIGVIIEMEKSCFKKYGVKNANKTKEVRDKIKKTCEKKYNSPCSMQNKEIQRSIRIKNLENLGVELPFQSREIQKKSKNTMELKYGGNTFKSPDLRKKYLKTMNERYNSSYTNQNELLFKKNQLSGLRLKQFKDTNIHYQGSYELDFLEHYYDKLNIKRSKSIKYKINESNHIYFPDFYIPELNLIIEIKNSYLAKRDKLKLSAKKYAVLKKGFNFIMIIDKDYSSFETILKHESINTKYS
jgi:hypothetical protein